MMTIEKELSLFIVEIKNVNRKKRKEKDPSAVIISPLDNSPALHTEVVSNRQEVTLFNTTKAREQAVCIHRTETKSL
jgi:hypothetical protein